MKTAEEVRADADQARRNVIIGFGVPAHRVAGERVRDFRQGEAPDLKSHGDKRTVTRVSYPGTVDRWLTEGGPGFEEPQAKAIEHCRKLWTCAGTLGRQVANYGGFGGGDSCHERDSWSQIDALTQLAEYQREIPLAYWTVFERMCRDDFSAGEAAMVFAATTPQRIAHAKNIVGFCASLVAMWRGY